MPTRTQVGCVMLISFLLPPAMAALVAAGMAKCLCHYGSHAACKVADGDVYCGATKKLIEEGHAWVRRRCGRFGTVYSCPPFPSRVAAQVNWLLHVLAVTLRIALFPAYLPCLSACLGPRLPGPCRAAPAPHPTPPAWTLPACLPSPPASLGGPLLPA